MTTTTGPRAVTRMVIAVLRFYQRAISPALPPRCRYSPTCSSYALEAITRFGLARGSWLAVRRILRCHPYHRGGHDPVPPAVATVQHRDLSGRSASWTRRHLATRHADRRLPAA